MIVTFRQPNFNKAMVEANRFLAEAESILKFPYCPKKFIEEFGAMAVYPYTYIRNRGLETGYFRGISGIFAQYVGRQGIIYDDLSIRAHQHFTLLHEYYHIIGGHDVSLDCEVLLQVMEIEANFFASQMLMPDLLIYELQRRGIKITVDLLMYIFGVSEPAAKKRLDLLRNHQLTSS